MQCNYFTTEQCTGIADYPWQCCDKIHGYRHKQDKEQMRKYQEGIIKIKDLRDGIINHWSIEKCIYYSNLM